MTISAALIARKRLDNQGLSRISFRRAAEIVRWFGGVQAQDFAGAKWALGQRLATATEAEIDAAFDTGEILRTHVMRPTWHFVAPEDLRWIQALTAPRVHRLNGYSYRKYEIDSRTIARSRTAIERALQDGRHLTREELGVAIRRAGVEFDGIRLAHLVMHAELEAAICSGPRRGRQFTYALTEQRVRRTRTLQGDEALAELTMRYFTAHGPATVRDFAWWSGLSIADAKKGIESLGRAIQADSVDRLTYWSVPSAHGRRQRGPLVHLLPNYDECLVAFKDRGVIAGLPAPRGATQHGSFPHRLVVDGRVSGAWRRTLGRKRIEVEVLPYRRLTPAESHALERAIERYAAFMELPAALRMLS